MINCVHQNLYFLKIDSYIRGGESCSQDINVLTGISVSGWNWYIYIYICIY